MVALNGDKKLESITIANKITNNEQTLDVDGIFVAIGRKPDTELLKELELTPNGFIKTNHQMQTNISGVYAIGDVRDTPLRQIVTACGDGAIAVNAILKS